jgi:ATP-dependent DNA helicase RecG
MRPDLKKLLAKGESETLEYKRSTGELREAMQTLCAFANRAGGKVVIGVKPDGKPVGQQVSDQTLHEIAVARERFEPPMDFECRGDARSGGARADRRRNQRFGTLHIRGAPL